MAYVGQNAMSQAMAQRQAVRTARRLNNSGFHAKATVRNFGDGDEAVALQVTGFRELPSYVTDLANRGSFHLSTDNGDLVFWDFR